MKVNQKNLIKNIAILIVTGLVIFGVIDTFKGNQILNLINNDKNIVNTQNVSQDSDNLTYQNNSFNLSFSYPKSWAPIIEEGPMNTCPEEDTYRTQDYLPIYDKEIIFKDIDLPETESFIRSGIRNKYLDEDNGMICGNDLLSKLASREIVGEILSSVALRTVKIGNLDGIYNENSSRLDTESRRQYTLFSKDSNGRPYAIQAYFSFVPYFGSKELNEIEKDFGGNITKYISEGKTSADIRIHLEEFETIVRSIQ